MQEPDSGTTLELQPKPVFNWLNTARVGTPRVQHGAVFVWTHKGRAEVIGTVFSQTIGAASPSMYHEFHALSTEPITAIRDNVVHWDVQQAGIEPKLVPDAPEPSPTRPLRMIQMREMARRFSGYSINYDDKRWDLSLLPQPLHRTDEGHPVVLDGAHFTMVSTAGTDPEILLVIEARQLDDHWRWHYSVCRFTDLKTWVSLDDKTIWSFENGSNGAGIDSGKEQRYRFSSECQFRIPAE